MKRLFISLLLFAMVLPAVAQDTIELPYTPPPTYYPKDTRWMADNPNASHLSIGKYSNDVPGIIDAKGHIIKDDSLRVIGLAGFFDTLWHVNTTAGSYLDTSFESGREPEFMMLYQPAPDTMILKKNVCYTDVPPKYRLKIRIIDNHHYQRFVWDYPRFYEVFFDDTVIVRDSFYVAWTYNNNYFVDGYYAHLQTGAYQILSNGYYDEDSLIYYHCRGGHWEHHGKYLCNVGCFPIIDTTGMFPRDTTQGEDTTAVDTTGIKTLASQFTYLVPNPAVEQTAVYCSFPMRSVAMFDATGRCVLRRRVDDRMVQIDVSGLARGSYHVVVYTTAGRAVKRLLVQ